MRLRGEHLALVAGIAVISVAVLQILRDRPVDWWLWMTGIALVAFGLFRHQLRNMKFSASGMELAIDAALTSPAEQLAKPTQAPDLKLLIASGVAMGAAAEWMGTDHIVQVTAVNTSDRPIGVDSVGLSLSDGRYIPVFESLPSPQNIRLPAILQPQQKASTWLKHDGLRDTLKDEGVRIEALLAMMADGSTRRQPVPEDWRKLGNRKP